MSGLAARGGGRPAAGPGPAPGCGRPYPRPVGFVGDLRSVLAEPHFGRLYATRMTSQFADGVLQASLASAVLFSPERQTDAAKVAAGFSVLLLPYSLVGPFAGVLLDR